MTGSLTFQLFLVLIVAAAVSASAHSREEKRRKNSRQWLSRRVFDTSDEEQLFGHFDRDVVTYNYANRMLDYFARNPVTLRERQCFDKAFTTSGNGLSIDFVIDVAPSPSHDAEDNMSANSPIGQYLELFRPSRSSTRSYFDFITRFIDIVSYGVKPELCHSVIIEKSTLASSGSIQRFFIRGRAINETFDLSKLGGDFSDVARNLKTLWPVSTGSKPETHMAKILTTNLGRMTKLALWNRDNGLPTVLNSDRHALPVYTVVISDGSSGLSLKELVDIESGADLSRTSIIDIGNHRFVDRLSWNDVIALRGIYTLTSPQTLPAMANSIRTMACLVGSNYQPQQQQQQQQQVQH